MSDIDVKGMKFLRIRRLSDDDDAEEVFRQQAMTTDSCAQRYGVEIVGTKDFANFSATEGKQVQPLLDIIQQVINGELAINGFILDAYSRWARSDVDEAILYAACREANLLILTDKEGLMMGAGTWAKRGSSTDQNEGYARDVGRHLNRKVIKQILDGAIPPTSGFVWGLDREYYDRHGVPKFRVRRLQDGRKAVLDPDPPHGLRYYLPAKLPRLGLLDAGDSFKWVPGDPELQAAAKEFFREFFKHKIPAYRIVARMNRDGVPSYRGKRWMNSTFLRLIHNPIWIGISRCFAVTSGRHCERDKNGPKMFPMSKRPGYNKNKIRRKRMPVVRKPSTMWFTAVQPKMVTFLDMDVKEIVEAQWEELKKHNGRLPNKKHEVRTYLPHKSRYFLSKLLRIKGEDVPMIGSDGPSRGNDALRYYITRRMETSPLAGAASERIRADTVEEKVKDVIRVVLQDFDIQAPLIARYMEEKRRSLLGMSDGTANLRMEKAQLENWYRTTFSVAGTKGQSLLVKESRRVEERLNQIDLQLLGDGATRPEFLECTVQEIVESVRRQFVELQSFLNLQVFESLRRLVSTLCSTLTFDPMNRIVDIEVSLPSWALSRRPLLLDFVGMKETSDGRSFPDTNSERIVLSQFSCSFSARRVMPCLTCQRLSGRAA